MDRKDFPRHTVEYTIQFYDLDPMQIVWHGNYLKYFETARSALFDKLNIDLYDYFLKTNYIFPVTKSSTRHILPLRYRDRVTITATLVEAKNKIVIDFEVRFAGTNRLCTKGRSEQVAVNAEDMKMEYRIPDDIREAMGF